VDQREFQAFARGFHDEQLEGLTAKTRDYADAGDQLANLRGTPNVDPRVALVVHIWKQFRAVSKAATAPEEELTQPVRERFLDIANYCILGAALFQEMGLAEQYMLTRSDDIIPPEAIC
jgi:hypothetical protein